MPLDRYKKRMETLMVSGPHSFTFQLTFDLAEDPEAFAKYSAEDLWNAICRAHPYMRCSGLKVEKLGRDEDDILETAGGR